VTALAVTDSRPLCETPVSRSLYGTVVRACGRPAIAADPAAVNVMNDMSAR
jgi:hypothetical protein